MEWVRETAAERPSSQTGKQNKRSDRISTLPRYKSADNVKNHRGASHGRDLNLKVLSTAPGLFRTHFYVPSQYTNFDERPDDHFDIAVPERVLHGDRQTDLTLEDAFARHPALPVFPEDSTILTRGKERRSRLMLPITQRESVLKTKSHKRNSWFQSSNPDHDPETSETAPPPPLQRSGSTSSDGSIVPASPNRSTTVTGRNNRRSYVPRNAAGSFLRSVNGASEEEKQEYRRSERYFSMTDEEKERYKHAIRASQPAGVVPHSTGRVSQRMTLTLNGAQQREWAEVMRLEEDAEERWDGGSDKTVAGEDADLHEDGGKFSNAQALAALMGASD